MSSRSVLVGLLGLGLLGALVGACETVDLGTPPADINACRPSQAYFVTDVWPNVLSKSYGGKHCYDSGCHGAMGRNALALIADPIPVLDPTQPIPVPLPSDWAQNYRSVTEQMSCTNVTASKLFVYPTATTTHGGGKLFDATSPEALIIEAWVTK